MAVLNKPALADFLRTVPGKSRDVRSRDQGLKPAGNAKLYMEVRRCAVSGFLCGSQCSRSSLFPPQFRVVASRRGDNWTGRSDRNGGRSMLVPNGASLRVLTMGEAEDRMTAQEGTPS